MTLGLCSVTFRPLSVDAILKLAAEAGIGAIEWSGDVHVPPHDLPLARDVGERTRALGIATPSYGSRYFLGSFGDFEAESRTAEALGATCVRVWAGHKEPSEIPREEYATLLQDTGRCADICATRGQTLCLEYHVATHTATPEGAVRLIRDTERSNVGTYFQSMYWHTPTAEGVHAEDLRAISLILPHLAHVHVYLRDGKLHRPLAEGRHLWREFVRAMGDRVYYLEFVKDGSPEQFLADARVLREILDQG